MSGVLDSDLGAGTMTNDVTNSCKRERKPTILQLGLAEFKESDQNVNPLIYVLKEGQITAATHRFIFLKRNFKKYKTSFKKYKSMGSCCDLPLF